MLKKDFSIKILLLMKLFIHPI